MFNPDRHFRKKIGVFGSRQLISHGILKNPFKDTDFVLHLSLDEVNILKNNMEKLHKSIGSTRITLQHAIYQAQKHGQHYNRENNTLIKCLLRKWSSCQITTGICSTLRFVSEIETGTQLLDLFAIEGKLCTITGYIRESIGASFIPRRFIVETEEKKIEVFILSWIFHQCVQDGDLVSVTGYASNHKLFVSEYRHGVFIHS